MSKKPFLLAPVVLLALIACANKESETAAPAPAESAAVPTETATSTEPTADEQERARKQAALDYSMMEDKFLNDPRGQWAESARASSSFGDANDDPPESQASNTPWQATGAPNGDTWSNNNQEIGMDWLEVKFAKPVTARELRAVMPNGEIVGSVSKVELIDTDGKYHEVWSGVDDTKRDDRGSRTWFVRAFEPAQYKTAGLKITIANAINSGYKEIDAVQIVGD